MKADLISANQEQIKIQSLARQQELAEEEKIVDFAKRKAARDLMKKEKES
jgi:hypothetical protein